MQRLLRLNDPALHIELPGSIPLQFSLLRLIHQNQDMGRHWDIWSKVILAYAETLNPKTLNLIPQKV